MLSQEQIKEIKKQIIEQIDSWHATAEQKQQAKEQIEEMDSGQLEEFLKKNNLIKQGQPTLSQEPQPKQGQCVFCMIIENKVPSYKIAETKTDIAILELNPVSKAHSLVLPKKHVLQEKIPSTTFTLAKKIAKKIKTKLKPKDVKISVLSLFGHSLIEVLPIYGNETGERKKAGEKELKELQEKLEIKEKSKPVKPKLKKQKQLENAPRRIP